MILDTNILIYAVGGDHPLRAPCADLIGRIGHGERRGTTTQPIATADPAFSAIDGLTVLDPATDGWLDERGGTVTR